MLDSIVWAVISECLERLYRAFLETKRLPFLWLALFGIGTAIVSVACIFAGVMLAKTWLTQLGVVAGILFFFLTIVEMFLLLWFRRSGTSLKESRLHLPRVSDDSQA